MSVVFKLNAELHHSMQWSISSLTWENLGNNSKSQQGWRVEGGCVGGGLRKRLSHSEVSKGTTVQLKTTKKKWYHSVTCSMTDALKTWVEVILVKWNIGSQLWWYLIMIEQLAVILLAMSSHCVKVVISQSDWSVMMRFDEFSFNQVSVEEQWLWFVRCK